MVTGMFVLSTLTLHSMMMFWVVWGGVFPLMGVVGSWVWFSKFKSTVSGWRYAAFGFSVFYVCCAVLVSMVVISALSSI
jgi:hypothetical protein